jgi:hypothetical protein
MDSPPVCFRVQKYLQTKRARTLYRYPSGMQTMILKGTGGSIDIMHFSLVFMKTSFLGLYKTTFKLLT